MGSANEQTSDLGSVHARNICSKSSGHSDAERETKASILEKKIFNGGRNNIIITIAMIYSHMYLFIQLTLKQHGFEQHKALIHGFFFTK